MGWGTTFKIDVDIPKESINTLSDVNDRIEDLKVLIESSKDNIRMMCSSTPKDIVPKEYEDDILMFLGNELDDTFSYMEENYRLLLSYYKLKEYLTEECGLKDEWQKIPDSIKY